MPVTADDLIRNILSLKAEALLNHKATPDYVISRLVQLAKAKKTERIKIRGYVGRKFAKGTRKIAQTDEEALIERDYADNSIQLQAISELKKILGLDAPSKIEASGKDGKSFAEELREVMKSIDGASRGVLPCDQED